MSKSLKPTSSGTRPTEPIFGCFAFILTGTIFTIVLMKRLATTLLLVLGVGAANAQEKLTNINPLHLELSFTEISAAARTNTGNFGVNSSDQFGKLTYYFRRQVFGEVGYGQSTLHKTSVNGLTLPRQSDESPVLTFYGLGARSYRRGSAGEYIGAGIRVTSNFADTREKIYSTNMLRLFSQKDTIRRYGIIQATREFNKLGDLTKLSGKHIWFANNGWGLGFQWAFGLGRDVDNFSNVTEYKTRDAGIVLMYRPSLINSQYEEDFTEIIYGENPNEVFEDELVDENQNTEEYVTGSDTAETVDTLPDDFFDEEDEFSEDEFSEDEFDDVDFSDDEFSEDEFSDDEFSDDEFSEDDFSEDEFSDDEFSEDDFNDDEFSDEDFSEEDFEDDEFDDVDFSEINFDE